MLRRFGKLLKTELITGMVLLAPVGGTLYLVYAHKSSNDLTDLRRPLDFSGELGALNVPGVAHGDTFLVKVDLLSAL